MPLDVLVNPESVPPLDLVDDDVRAGLEFDRDRLDAAHDNEEFYQLRNLAYLEKRPEETEEDFDHRPKRTSKLTRTVVRKLSEPLYKPGPTRKLEGPPALDTWLQQVDADNHLNARMQSADRGATLNHV